MKRRTESFVQTVTRSGRSPATPDAASRGRASDYPDASRRPWERCANLVASALLAAFAALPGAAYADFSVSEQPLNIGGQGIPGNLALVPSVEWPTITGVANIDPVYDSATEYAGYFDARKCYRYVYDSNESQRRFEPVSQISGNDLICSGQWSGNFLNWAATQTIDPFRKALTGGYRVKDTPTETWLEKAWHTGQGGTRVYPIRSLTNSTDVANATPFKASSFHVEIEGHGNEMHFWLGDSPDSDVEAYDGSSSVDDDIQEASVRVKVCDPAVGVESNCQPYDQGWKPEGVIQKNADKLRYSVFGYLNDHDQERDGGVLRARNKFVGPTFFDPDQGAWVANPEVEWDPDTGVLVRNPSPQDASDTEAEFGIAIDDSGVINYINKFGQMTGKNHKSKDPVSELYYTALRYFRNLGNVPAYTDMSGLDATTKKEFTDLFPVITDWDDPIDAWCERNVILGIGDVNTHRDKNLPGNKTYLTDEPPTPSEVNKDNDVDVIQATNKVGELEGLGSDIAETDSWSGRMNSAYIAGLAYDAHTQDIRSDLDNSQTVSTFWVDVLEGQILRAPEENQYYLASKYGGFEVPDPFDPYARTQPLPEEWWHTTGDTLALTVLDEFDDQLYTNDDGTASWGGPWVEVDDDGDPASGQVQITGNALRLDNHDGGNLEAVTRAVDLSTATSAVLSFNFSILGDVETSDSALVQVSSDGGSSWATLEDFTGYDAPASGSRSYDISAYASADTRIRVKLNAAYGASDEYFAVDDVKVTYPSAAFKRPDNYYTAGRAKDMVTQLEKAFSDIVAHTTGSASSIAANSTRLDTGTVIYQARFNTRAWSGQVLALEVDPTDGTVDTANPLWDAANLIPGPASRSLFTFDADAGVGIPFEWVDLNATQQNALNTDIVGNADGLGSQRLDYLRGDRSLEVQNGGSFRDRESELGDIVGSDPFFVGVDNFGYTVLAPPAGDDYRPFLQDKTTRRKMLYVGANDGMLHGFDATTGKEVLAYVPNGVFDRLSHLTAPKYSHRYYVNGAPRAGDAYIDIGAGDEWRTILAGGTGQGGRAIYALDVTEPDTFGTNDVLWEFTHAELGLTMSQPFVVRMNDGEWYMAFGNGYNSTSGTARLFLVSLEDPTDYTVIDTGVGGTGADANGLSSIITVDTTGDRTTDVIYGGDMKGNLWKFDVTGGRTNWKVAYKQAGKPAPLFTAVGPDGNPQPITATPEVGPHPDGGVMVYFGTGKFFEVGDNTVPATPQAQSFYAIHDDGDAVSGRAALQEQTIVFEGTPAGADFEVRVTSDTSATSTQDGWYIDLVSPVNGREGERVIHRAALREDRIIFVTNIPSGDACGFGGDSWVMEMHAIEGRRLHVAVFDLNGDGTFDASDLVSYDSEQGHAGGRKLDEFVSKPAILDTAGIKEFKYLSGSSGAVMKVEESGGANDTGRQSWRELQR